VHDNQPHRISISTGLI